MVNFDLKHYEPNNESSQQAMGFESQHEFECVVDVETPRCWAISQGGLRNR
jgi:hypothetical protein